LRGEGLAGLPERAAPHLTRRGSLAYYLAAWVCGSLFFLAGRYVLPGSGNMKTAPFFGEYFMTLIWGAPAVLAFALALRRILAAQRRRSTLVWCDAGGVLALLMGAATLPVKCADTDVRSGVCRFLDIVALGRAAQFPGFSGRQAVSLAFGGLATAFVLARVEKAFSADEAASS